MIERVYEHGRLLGIRLLETEAPDPPPPRGTAHARQQPRLALPRPPPLVAADRPTRHVERIALAADGLFAKLNALALFSAPLLPRPPTWRISPARRPSRICAWCLGSPRGSRSGFSKACPGQSHARACLLDHAAELRDALGELLEDEEVSVELAEETLEQAARVWSREHD